MLRANACDLLTNIMVKKSFPLRESRIWETVPMATSREYPLMLPLTSINMTISLGVDIA